MIRPAVMPFVWFKEMSTLRRPSVVTNLMMGTFAFEMTDT